MTTDRSKSYGSVIPYPFQEKAIEKVSSLFSWYRYILLISPTGSGKTTMASIMAHIAHSRQKRILIVMDRDRLIGQWSDAMRKVVVPHTFIKAGRAYNKYAEVFIASWQTLNNREVPNVGMVLVDEAHEWLDAQINLRNKLPKAYFIGMTATPWRSDGRSLKEVYNEVVVAAKPSVLLANGVLVPAKPFVKFIPNLSGVNKTASGDFDENQLADVMNKKELIGDAVTHYKEICNGKIGLAYGVNKAHAVAIQQLFNEAGIPCGLVVAETPEEEREAQIAKLLRRELLLIANVYIFVKGTDIPALEVMVDMAPTDSVSKYIQMAGRFARKFKGKDFFYQLDHAGNVSRHGSYSQDRDYSLGDVLQSANRKAIEAGSVKVCPSCFLSVPSELKECPSCGHKFTPDAKAIDVKDGKLVEMIIEDMVVTSSHGTLTYRSQGVLFTLTTPHKEFYEGDCLVKRRGNAYNFYGKVVNEADHRKAMLHLLDMLTGGSDRRELISMLRIYESMGKPIQNAFYRFKKMKNRNLPMYDYYGKK